MHPCTNSKKPFNEWNNFSLKSIFLQSSDCDIDILLGVIKSLPYLEKLAVWTSAEHLPPMKEDLLSKLQCLEMGGLNHESLLKEFMSLLGDKVTTLKLETVHFDIDINLLGETCKCLEDNTISDSFSTLKKFYFFLVNYVMNSPEQKFLVHLPPVL